MQVVILIEWDNPKDEERTWKRLKYANEVVGPYLRKLEKEQDIKVEKSEWSDGTGHIVLWWKFETMEDYAKMFEDERMQQIHHRWVNLADNVRIRVMRPSVTIPEDLK